MKRFWSLCLLLVFLSPFGPAALATDDYRVALFTEGGAPESPPDIKILVNTGYAVGYSEELKCPLWAVYRLGNKKSGDAVKWERPVRFEVDSRTQARVSHDDFERNWDGITWDRGHLAPNSAMEGQYGQIAQLETYFMSNIMPQSSRLNQGLWMQLEGQIRDVISQDDTPNKEVSDVWVICGPIFANTPIVRWPSGVAVPTHCFMIVAYRKGYGGTVKAAGFVFPQKPTLTTIGEHAVTIRQIEAMTGLNFFPEYSTIKQRNLETVRRDLQLNELP